MMSHPSASDHSLGPLPSRGNPNGIPIDMLLTKTHDASATKSKHLGMDMFQLYAVRLAASHCGWLWLSLMYSYVVLLPDKTYILRMSPQLEKSYCRPTKHSLCDIRRHCSIRTDDRDREHDVPAESICSHVDEHEHQLAAEVDG